ncbi:zinc-binding dehydrogenase [Leucobacter luti]|uniref:S-(Hydroxymethyl)glutathione dehydrogenase/alcohol dehydrogenase n=1 Tax=Leucobacter luti TaxID=340320 RepID=A0A4Q7U9H5_9MICO|nr:zinc-binding dehydrogenase [Leucobacter luti]MBL3700919.1 alcohol dehydrogenase [Leucobacter luti]RZT68862.1 S-(hydroxymethyl)glutathione dehydrogenase/alcohol dehydrogenase [Leucobacter luti]
MKASLVREFGKGFEIADVDIAAPVGREVLVEVKASGLCHSDELAANHDLGYTPPMLLGHEVAGVVTQLGPDVTQFAVGDHVVGCLVQYCGACDKCLQGKVSLCLNPGATVRAEGEAPRLTENGAPVAQGMGLGGFAQQVLVHENQLAAVPEEMPWPQAALLGCGVVTGAGAVLNTANVQPSDTVVVIGLGGVGLNAINGAITAGAATIIAIDIADDKLDRAKEFGATHVINSKTSDPVAEVLAITGNGADAVFDFVGVGPVTEQGLKMVAPGGGLFLIGVLDPSATIPVSSIDMLTNRRRIEGVYMGSTTAKRDIPLFAKLYLEGRFELDSLVSKEISLSEINEGYASLKDPKIARVVVTDLS